MRVFVMVVGVDLQQVWCDERCVTRESVPIAHITIAKVAPSSKLVFGPNWFENRVSSKKKKTSNLGVFQSRVQGASNADIMCSV